MAVVGENIEITEGSTTVGTARVVNIEDPDSAAEGPVRVFLGEGARGYVGRTLAGGGPLCSAMASQMDRLVRTYTWGPSSVDGQMLDAHLDEGGLLTPFSRQPHEHMVRVIDVGRDLLIEFVTSFLRQPASWFLVDDPWREPADIQPQGLSAVRVGSDRVMHVLGSGASRDEVDALLRGVLTWNWAGALTTLPGSKLSLDREVSLGTVTEAAGRAQHLVLPAFDHEGWVVADLRVAE